MKRFILLLCSCLVISACKQRKTNDQQSQIASYRSDGGQRFIDIGIFLSEDETTETGELLPDQMGWKGYPRGFSGDKLIGRTANGIGERFQDPDKILVAKIKIIDPNVSAIPTYISLKQGYWGANQCKTDESVQIKSIDSRGVEGMAVFCKAIEADGQYSGATILYSRISLQDNEDPNYPVATAIELEATVEKNGQDLIARTTVSNLVYLDNSSSDNAVVSALPFQILAPLEFKSETEQEEPIATEEKNPDQTPDNSSAIPVPTPTPLKRPEPVHDASKNAPASSSNFFELPPGTLVSKGVDGLVNLGNYQSFSTKGKAYNTSVQTGGDWGYGTASSRFGQKEANEYCQYRTASQESDNYHIQWKISDIEDSQQTIESSKQADWNFYGASLVKIYIGAAWLAGNQGRLNNKTDLVALLSLIATSNNNSWIKIRNIVENNGMLDAFMSNQGYRISQAHRGSYQGRLGNMVNAAETNDFFYDTYHNNYDGAKVLWPMLYTCLTCRDRGNKYLPQNLQVGGKTGKYAESNHHATTFRYNDRQYVITVLTGRRYNYDLTDFLPASQKKNGSARKSGIMIGGLFREFIAKSLTCN